MLSKKTTAGILGLFQAFATSALAHGPFESTVVAALRHGRLEVVVDMANPLGGLLVQDPENPEAASLSAGSLESYRELLEQRATRLYQITAGGTELVPERVVPSVSEANHLKLVLIYPQPEDWPLKIKALPIDNVPPSYTSSIRVLDDNENILGLGNMAPQSQKDVELSVSPKPLVKSTPPNTPVADPVGSPKPPVKSILVLALCGAAVVFPGCMLYKRLNA